MPPRPVLRSGLLWASVSSRMPAMWMWRIWPGGWTPPATKWTRGAGPAAMPVEEVLLPPPRVRRRRPPGCRDHLRAEASVTVGRTALTPRVKQMAKLNGEDCRRSRSRRHISPDWLRRVRGVPRSLPPPHPPLQIAPCRKNLNQAVPMAPTIVPQATSSLVPKPSTGQRPSNPTSHHRPTPTICSGRRRICATYRKHRSIWTGGATSRHRARSCRNCSRRPIRDRRRWVALLVVSIAISRVRVA